MAGSTRGERLLDVAHQVRADGQDLERVLAALRDAGATMIDSVKIVRELESVPLGEAKQILDSSTTWADERAQHDELRRMAVEALDDPSPDVP
jgi:ribosomal protein L7/L12